jgi:hypothetical protein
VRDANGQALSHIYYESEPGRRCVMLAELRPYADATRRSHCAASADAQHNPFRAFFLLHAVQRQRTDLGASLLCTRPRAGIGQLRVIETIDGKQIIERLDAIDNSASFYRYTSISGIPASDYTGTLQVEPNGTGSSVEWGAQYPEGSR